MQTEKSVQLAPTDLCTGCGACMEICPKGAITFQDDEEGFPSPIIDAAACVSCGLCERTCPALSLRLTNTIQGAYAAQIKDRDVLLQSTSGGLFTALSREVFRRNGVVYGCVWNEERNAVIQKAENEEEILPMRGSKYVWSWAGDAFPEIKSFLTAGRTVLFVGLPCQVAGLKQLLSKDYPNLICVEFFCGGAPSPMALRAYFDSITRDVAFDRLNFKFRDKVKYGVGVHISYQGKRERIHQSWVSNSYFWTYHNKFFHRKSCLNCLYRYKNRVADITIGDFWSVKKYHPEMDTKAGVSSVLINSDKGAIFFQSIREQLILIPSKLESIADYQNLTLTDKIVEYHPASFRKELFNTVRTKGWKAAERKYLLTKPRIILLLKQTRVGSVGRRIKTLIQKLR